VVVALSARVIRPVSHRSVLPFLVPCPRVIAAENTPRCRSVRYRAFSPFGVLHSPCVPCFADSFRFGLVREFPFAETFLIGLLTGLNPVES
jgi:hypothetical protein